MSTHAMTALLPQLVGVPMSAGILRSSLAVLNVRRVLNVFVYHSFEREPRMLQERIDELEVEEFVERFGEPSDRFVNAEVDDEELVEVVRLLVMRHRHAALDWSPFVCHVSVGPHEVVDPDIGELLWDGWLSFNVYGDLTPLRDEFKQVLEANSEWNGYVTRLAEAIGVPIATRVLTG